MQLEFRDRYQLEDYFRGIDLVYRQPFGFLGWFLPAVFLAISVIAGDIVSVWSFLAVAIIAVVVLSSLTIAARRRRDKDAIRRGYQEVDSTVVITDDEIRKEDGSLVYRSSWKDLKQYKEDSHCFALLFATTLFVIPKRFLSATQVSDFRTLLRN